MTHPSHGSDFYAPAVDLAEIEPSNGIYTFNDGSTLEYLESGEFELTFGGPRGVYDEIPTLLLKEGISSLGEARFLFTMSEVASFRIGSPTNHDTYTTSALILPETDPTHYFGFGFRSFSTTDPEAAGKRIRFKIQGTRYTEDSSEKCHVRFLKREIELEGAELDEVKHYIRPHDFRDIEFNFDFDTILGGPPLSVGFLDDSTVGIAGITSDRRFFALATTYNYESSTSLDNFEPQRPLYNDLYRFFDLSIPEGVTPIIHDTAQLVKTFGSYVAWPTEEGAVILHMENNDNDWPETFDLKSYVHVRDADLEVLDRSDRACIDGAGALYWYLARVTEGVNIDRRVIVSVRFDPWTKAIQTTRALLPALVGQATRIGITGSVYLYLWNHEDPTRALHRVTARANSVTGLQNAGNWRTFTNPEFEGTEIRHLKYWSVTDTGQVFTPNPQSSTNNWTLRGYLPLEHNYSNADFSVYTDYLAGSFALSDVTYTSQTAVYHEGALKHALRVRHNDMFGNIITLTEDQKPTHFNPFGLGGNSRWIGWNDSFSHIRIM